MIPSDLNIPTGAMSVESLAQIIPQSLNFQSNTSVGLNAQPWALRHGIMHASYPTPSIEVRFFLTHTHKPNMFKIHTNTF